MGNNKKKTTVSFDFNLDLDENTIEKITEVLHDTFKGNKDYVDSSIVVFNGYNSGGYNEAGALIYPDELTSDISDGLKEAFGKILEIINITKQEGDKDEHETK